MSGELNLQALFKSLTAILIDGVYVFITIPTDGVPDGITPRMQFEEAEGTTLIMLQSEAEALGLEYEFPCRMITLDVHSSLEAVGFIAYIATQLAKHDMGVNPVSGFYHDHLFVPNGREQDALDILKQIAEEAG
jgi:hypothetical protein